MLIVKCICGFDNNVINSFKKVFFPNLSVDLEKLYTDGCLLLILEKQKVAVDNKAFELLSIIAKPFDCLSHDQLIVEMNSYHKILPLDNFTDNTGKST